MTEQTGIARALAVLGDKIGEAEGLRRLAIEAKEAYKREADELREKNKELTERLKQAEDDRDAACSYALQLERLLEECRKAYNALHEGEPKPPEGGADNCKKSQ